MENTKSTLEHFRFLLDNLDFSVTEREFIYNDKGEPIDYKFIYVNKTFSELLNTTPDKIVGKTATVIFPESPDYLLEEYYDVVKTGIPFTMTKYQDHVERYFSVYAYKTGENSFVLSFKDITNILKSAGKFELNKADGKMMKDIAKIGFFELNRKTLKADVSETFNKIVGLDKIEEGFFRETLLKLTHKDHFDKIKNIIIDVLNGNITEIETQFKLYNKKHDHYHWMDFFIFAIEYDEKGKPIRYTGMVRDIEKEKNQTEEVKEITELFREARRVADLSTFIYIAETKSFVPSEELDLFTGVENLTTLEQFRSIVHPEDIKVYDKATDYILDGSKDKVTVYRIIKDEKIKFVQSSIFGKYDEQGNAIKVFGILKDITDIETERRRAENLSKSFKLIFDSSPAGIFLLDSDLEIAMENETFRDFFGIEEHAMKLKALLGNKYDEVIEHLKEERDISNLRVKYIVAGVLKHFAVNITKIDKEFDNDFEGTLVDITEQVEGEERINYLATHDVLTDLYNRNYFEDIIIKKKTDYPLGIVLCDIDGLKLMNDAFGHLKGDELLRGFADILKALSPSYTATRIGGDEFAILVDNATEEKLMNIEKKIKESIKDIGLYGLDFEVSCGYAILSEIETDFSNVFNKAENMMYRRKLTERAFRKSNALETILKSLHEKTEESKEHCEKVGYYATQLLFESGYKRNADLEDMKYLCNVHDIGKIATPQNILNKHGKLTINEYEQIKYHSEAGYKIIKNIIDNENIAYGVLYHHERFDGTGYPHGLSGEEIPLYARVLAIADAYDAMTRGRIYRLKKTKAAALKEIEKNKGTQFDPVLADSFIKLIKAEK